jgi:ribosomal protein L28
MSDEPQFSVVARAVGTGYATIHSNHKTRREAEVAKDQLAWDVNRREVQLHLAIVAL